MTYSVASFSSLGTLVSSFEAEADQLEGIFAICIGHPRVSGYDHPYVPTEDGCVVSLWDAWNRYLRSLVLVSASGPVVSLGGSTYQPRNARSEDEALRYLKQNSRRHAYRVTRNEPNWHMPNAFVDIVVCLELDPIQTRTLSGAISATSIALGSISVPNPVEEIRICRNFIAHKSSVTLRDVKSYARGTYSDLSSHLRRKRSGVETFTEWKECMVAIAVAMAQ